MGIAYTVGGISGLSTYLAKTDNSSVGKSEHFVYQ